MYNTQFRHTVLFLTALSQPMIRTAVVYRYQEKQEVRI